MEKQTKPELLGASMAKKILVAAIIVSAAIIIGVAGYLIANKSKIKPDVLPTTQKQESIRDIDLDIGNPLVVEEYPIDEDVAINCTGPFDIAAKVLPQEILKKREKWRKALPRKEKVEKEIEYINKIKTVGYKFLQESSDFESYSFYKGQNLIEKRLHNIQGFSMDSKERHFVFSASKWGMTYPECNLVCIDGDIQTEEKFGFNPVWINDDLWRIKLAGSIDHTELYLIVNDFIDKSLLDEILEKTRTGASWMGEEIQGREVWIRKYNLPDLPSQVIYPFFLPIVAGGGPAIKLWAWGESWVLETGEDVIINGKSLGEEKEAIIYGFHLIKDKPFYFFTSPQDYDSNAEWPGIKKVRISYNDKILPVWYDWVGVWPLSGGEYDVWKNENMVWFIAKRGNQWYYVEAGNYE